MMRVKDRFQLLACVLVTILAVQADQVAVLHIFILAGNMFCFLEFHSIKIKRFSQNP